MIAANRIIYLQERIGLFSDEAAYKELFTGFYSFLHHFAMDIVRSKQSAEEIVSDVFLRIWEKRRDLDRIANLKVYLYIATRNTALNYLEKQKKVSTNPLDGLTAVLRSLYFDPEQMMITSEMMARIEQAIDNLPQKCKMIFKLVREDGMKYREAAEILGISAKTVENQLAIALQKISEAVSFDIKRSIFSPC
jgi:RNA polymerase sigma-70 factor (family 1)